MSRIELLRNRSQLNTRQQAVYDAIVAGPRGKIEGPLLAALHNPELADKWQQFGAALRFETSLPRSQSELVILVTARAWACQLEWHLHEGYAREAGLPQALIDAVRQGNRAAITGEDMLVIHDFIDLLQRTKRVDERVYQRALDLFGTLGVVEMTALSGYYTMVAMTLNAHAFPLPDGVTPPLPEPAL